MRGEQLGDALNDIGGKGSPPLARGTGGVAVLYAPVGGITPACAGNRAEVGCDAWWYWDHPRLRGEQGDSTSADCVQVGSPPLARGTAFLEYTMILLAGITPACAGNSVFGIYHDTFGGDHPRLRGEQEDTAYFPVNSVGSPPLARGTAYYGRARVGLGGITPACAGNSCLTSWTCKKSGEQVGDGVTAARA